jgi:hypothetical protein
VLKGAEQSWFRRTLGWSGRHLRNYKSSIYNFKEMAMTKHKTSPIHSEPTGTPVHNGQGGLGTFARIFWILIGNVVLLVMALGIFQRHAPFFSFAAIDLAYWITVLLLVVIRYCDIKYLGGLTAKDEPATIVHWRKYAMFLLLIVTGVWLLAHAATFFHK